MLWVKIEECNLTLGILGHSSWSVENIWQFFLLFVFFMPLISWCKNNQRCFSSLCMLVGLHRFQGLAQPAIPLLWEQDQSVKSNLADFISKFWCGKEKCYTNVTGSPWDSLYWNIILHRGYIYIFNIYIFYIYIHTHARAHTKKCLW